MKYNQGSVQDKPHLWPLTVMLKYLNKMNVAQFVFVSCTIAPGENTGYLIYC